MDYEKRIAELEKEQEKYLPLSIGKYEAQMKIDTIKQMGLTRPKTFRQLLGFLAANQGRDCFSKFQGAVWMITKEGKWKRVCDNLPDLTFREYLDLSLTL